MTNHPSRVRRGLLGAAAILAFGLVAPPAAFAQDAQSSSAQRAAREWLALVDAHNVNAAWRAAGAKFKRTLTAQRWAQTLNAQREPLGPVVQRTLVSTRFTKAPQGRAPGDYAVIVFRTTFAKRNAASENVTVEREADGVWRVVGYVIS
jgi:hypothetical protein